MEDGGYWEGIFGGWLEGGFWVRVGCRGGLGWDVLVVVFLAWLWGCYKVGCWLELVELVLYGRWWLKCTLLAGEGVGVDFWMELCDWWCGLWLVL